MPVDAPRTILHVDMDAFFASVEQRDFPELRGKPLVVGGDPAKRGVVAAASYEARTFGIHSAMPIREAHRRCPDAVFVRGRGKAYKQASVQVFALFESVTPCVQPVSIDEAFLDVTGVLHFWKGDAVRLAETLRARIRAEVQLTASVGIASNKFLAKLASDMNKPDGHTVVPRAPEDIRAFLAPLEAGRIWGVGKKSAAVLERHGVRTIGDLQQIPLPRLSSWFGEASARHLHALSLGLDDRPVHENPPEKSMSAEHTFDEDQTDPAVWRACLLRQSEEVGRRLRADGLWAGRVHLKARDDRFRTRTRQTTLETQTRRDMDIHHTAWDLLQALGPERPLRLLGVGVSNLTDTPAGPKARQLDLFSPSPPATPREGKLDSAVDLLRQKYGQNAVRRGMAPSRAQRS